MRILLVEDDPLLGDGIAVALRRQGDSLDWLQDGGQALEALQRHPFDLVILDLGLPGMDGLTLLRRLRQLRIAVPVLILTARDGVDDRIAGLDAGADDYLLKPFDLGELQARIRALLRRTGGQATPCLEYAHLQIDPAAHRVSSHGQPVPLSRREYALLLELVHHQGRVLTRNQLIELLYGWQEEVESNTLEVHIHHLRRKLGSDLIKTVRGVGYTLEKQPG